MGCPHRFASFDRAFLACATKCRAASPVEPAPSWRQSWTVTTPAALPRFSCAARWLFQLSHASHQYRKPSDSAFPHRQHPPQTVTTAPKAQRPQAPSQLSLPSLRHVGRPAAAERARHGRSASPILRLRKVVTRISTRLLRYATVTNGTAHECSRRVNPDARRQEFRSNRVD